MVGFFDSWIGGLAVMRDFKEILPGLDTTFYGDRSNCPYGDRSNEEIRMLTEKWVAFLVEKWAKIIILACNTAAAHSIRYLQNTVYPKGSWIQILWVTVPWAEEVVQFNHSSVWVLATNATVRSWAYTERIQLLNATIRVHEASVPWLVNAIENGENTFESLFLLLRPAIESFPDDIESVILGCTHYPFAEKAISEALFSRFQRTIPLVNPSKIAAQKFVHYLKKHPEFTVTFHWKEEVFWG